MHEESVEEFRQDIENAILDKYPGTGKEYLDWLGNECRTSAPYILDRTGQTLYIARHDNYFEGIPGSQCIPCRLIGKTWKEETDYPASGERPHMRIGSTP